MIHIIGVLRASYSLWLAAAMSLSSHTLHRYCCLFFLVPDWKQAILKSCSVVVVLNVSKVLVLLMKTTT
ncbi:hypothetical protein CPC08DRAFT_224180 [Agrocybe pediades]|nr:hypothetical protein CPC08DRAFT_224180 [Agrocybe pediades]